MFAILFEVLLLEIQEEIHHFAGWEGGGLLRGAKIVNKNFVNKRAFPTEVLAFFVFLVFVFVLRFSLFFFVHFCSLSKVFKGSAERKILAFFRGILAFLRK